MDSENTPSPEARDIDPWGLGQVENLLLGLPGIKSLKLVPNGHGGVDEVHVVATNQIGAKQVVRNIESALLAEFGLQIDHRKISVAQVDEPDIHPDESPSYRENGGSVPRDDLPAAPPEDDEVGDLEPVAPVRMRRLLLKGVEIDREAGETATCRVLLEAGDDSYEGEAEGPDFFRSRLELAGQAVLEALNQATLDDVQLRLEGVTLVDVVDRELVVAVVQGQENRRGVVLPGVSVIEDSPEEAAVLACLQATNRWASVA